MPASSPLSQLSRAIFQLRFACPLKVSSFYSESRRAFHATYVVSARFRKQHSRVLSNFHLDEDGYGEWKPKSNGGPSLEAIEELVTQDPSNHISEMTKISRRKQIIKSKIIERKYFKPIPYANILTWKCQTQIKYLYNEEKDADAILKLFPVTENMLYKLLRQRKVMKYADEIDNHDHRVYKKWIQLLKQHPAEMPESLQFSLQELIDTGQIKNICNAAGVADVPYNHPPTLKELADRTPSQSGHFMQMFQKHSCFRAAGNQLHPGSGSLTAKNPPSKSYRKPYSAKMGDTPAILLSILNRYQT